ncbi:MAG: DUF2029 domain-containing protein [Candidatus Schekmanbacteria bacterium]|nr:DUF2029 domain-containing protein [Candidatus Schekmanbacteria bacterium]
MDKDKLNIWVLLLIIAVSIKFLINDFFAFITSETKYIDFPSYYGAAILLKKGLNIYLVDNYVSLFSNSNILPPEANIYPFVYPPFFTLLLIPLSIFNYNHAAIIWNFLNLLFLLTGLVFLYKSIEIERKYRTIFLVCLTLLVSIFQPIVACLWKGQVDILVFMLFSVFLYYLKKNRFYISSFAFACMALIKVYPLGFLIYFLVKRKWKILITFISILIVLLSITIALTGYNNNLLYLTKILPEFSSGSYTNFKFNPFPLLENHSITSIFYKNLYSNNIKYVLPSKVKNIITIINLLFWISVIIILNKRKDIAFAENEMSLILITILITLPILWSHFMVILIFPYLLLIKYFLNTAIDKPFIILLTLLSFLLLNATIPVNYYRLNSEFKAIISIALNFRLYSLFILYFIYYYIIKTNRRPQDFKLGDE